jgi:hypothetical protein
MFGNKVRASENRVAIVENLQQQRQAHTNTFLENNVSFDKSEARQRNKETIDTESKEKGNGNGRENKGKGLPKRTIKLCRTNKSGRKQATPALLPII